MVELEFNWQYTSRGLTTRVRVGYTEYEHTVNLHELCRYDDGHRQAMDTTNMEKGGSGFEYCILRDFS